MADTQRRRSQAALVAVLTLAAALPACTQGVQRVQSAVVRHREAIAKLPDEQRARGAPYGLPASGEVAQAEISPGMLTLSEARRQALLSNPDVHAALARLSASLARIKEARSSYFPTLSLTHTWTRTFLTPANRNRLNTLLQPTPALPTDLTTQNIAVTTIINALRRPLFGSDPAGDTNSFSENSAALTASWTIFDGFVREARLLAAKHLFRATAASMVEVQRLLLRSVDQAYYQVQLAQEQIRIAKADEAFGQEQFEETQKLKAAGRATQADVDNFRVRVLAAQATVTAAKGRLETGRVILAELLGIDNGVLDDQVTLEPLSKESEELLHLPAVEEWIDRAFVYRPDLSQATHLVRNAREEFRAVRGLFLPTIAISGSWGFDRTSTLDYSRDDMSSAGALEFRWDLFTGGARRARLEVARSALAEAEAILRRQRLAVQSEVRQSMIDLANALEQIRLQSETLTTARENRRMVQAAYVAGKETLNRLNEAQRDFIEADANLTLARIRLRQAWSDLYAAAASYPEARREGDETPEP